MRRIVDIMAILTVLTVAGAWWMTRDRTDQQSLITETRGSVDLLRAQILLRSQSDRAVLNEMGWPASIDPDWFGSDLPMNALVDPDRVWLEIAAPEQSGWRHPRPLFTLDRQTAMFWYNPYLGIVRARVGLRPTDDETLADYNAVNSVGLPSLDPSSFGDRDAVKLTSIDLGVEVGED